MYREREKEREKREKKQRENNVFFFQKKDSRQTKKIKINKKNALDPGLRCPGALVPGIPSKLDAVGVNELFFEVTVDASFTTEQAVVGSIDEIHILIAVRTAPIVGYVSPSQIYDACALLRARKLDMEIPPDSLEDFLTKTTRVSAPWCAPTSSLSFSICPSRPGDFLEEFFFFKEFATNTG